MTIFSVTPPTTPPRDIRTAGDDIAIGGGYNNAQSTPPYVLGNTGGGSTGGGGGSRGGSSGGSSGGGSTFRDWLGQLQDTLSKLYNTLSNWNSPSGGAGGGAGGAGSAGGGAGGAGGGAGGGGSAGGAGGGGGQAGSYYSSFPPPPPAFKVENSPVFASESTAPILTSGLVSTLSPDKEELNQRQKTIASILKAGAFPGVTLRTGLLEQIKNLLNAPIKEQGATLVFSHPPTGTTKPDTNVQGQVTSPDNILNTLYGMSSRAQGINMGAEGGGTITKGGGTTTQGGGTTTETFDKVVTETSNQFAEIQNALNELEEKFKQFREEEERKKSEGAEDEVWINKWRDEFFAMRDMYYNKLAPLSEQIDQIDKVLLQAQEGFRKTAEDIRNNPDLTVWQQARRLKELEDLQNYAPIFNGLSYKDLVEYRKILADTLNKYIDAYNDTMNMASDFAINVEQLKIQKSNKEYQGLSDVLGLSQKILDLQRSLSSYGYSQFEYTDTRTGEKHVGVQYEDPRTHKITVVSDTIIGKTAPSSASSTQSIDTLSLLMKEIYPRISQAVSLKTPLSADDYYNLLARWHSVAGSKYDSEFDKFLKTYGVHPSSGGLGANPFA